MIIIKKALIFNGRARVAIVDSTDACKTLVEMHNLSPVAAAALGRALTASAYLISNLKSTSDRLSMTINGGGPLGKIIIAGEANKIRGYVQNPLIDLPLRADNKLDVAGAVGKKGTINVIKDLGLKEPYVGVCELVTGEIAEDFAHYLLKSEGITNAVALGVLTENQGVVACGGVIIEAMPEISEPQLYMLEDIMSNFSNVSSLLKEKSINEIMEFYFSHLEASIFKDERIILECKCSNEKMKDLIKSLGKNEVNELLNERGNIEINCEFCSEKYQYTKDDILEIFKGI